MSLDRVWPWVLALVSVLSLLISQRLWATSQCQRGVLEIMGVRGRIHPDSHTISIRSLLDHGQLSLTRCSWRGEPELSWQIAATSRPDQPLGSTSIQLSLRAQLQSGAWQSRWRFTSQSSLSSQDWSSLETIFHAPLKRYTKNARHTAPD